MAVAIYPLDRAIIKIKDSDPTNCGAIPAKGLVSEQGTQWIKMVASELESCVMYH